MSAVAISEPTTKAEYYSILTIKERELSESLGKTFFNSSRKSVEAIKEAGDALILAKKKLKNKFMYFCKYELPVDCSHDTIEGFMRLATIINERPQLIKYNPTILFELSKRSTPPEIVEEMTALAETDQHQEVKVKEVKEKIAEAKKGIIPIKKGSIVEWQMSVKGYTFGVVRSKTSDGIVCKIESLNGKYLGEKATKQIKLCAIQKVHSGIIDTEALQVKTGQKVIVSPYETATQNLAGMEGIVIVRYPQRRIFTVKIGEIVRDFFWEELRLPIEEPTPPPTEEKLVTGKAEEESENIIDVEAETVNETPLLPEAPPKIETPSSPEIPPSIDVKKMGWGQKRQLLKELLKEMQYGTALPKSQIEIEVDNLVEKTLNEMNDLGWAQRLREQFVVIFLDKCL